MFIIYSCFFLRKFVPSVVIARNNSVRIGILHTIWDVIYAELLEIITRYCFSSITNIFLQVKFYPFVVKMSDVYEEYPISQPQYDGMDVCQSTR